MTITLLPADIPYASLFTLTGRGVIDEKKYIDISTEKYCQAFNSRNKLRYISEINLYGDGLHV